MEAEARAKEMAFHAEAFVENLDRDQLFNAMFENDANGKTLLTMGEAAMDVYNKYPCLGPLVVLSLTNRSRVLNSIAETDQQ